jgi:hypothetical protein
MRAEPVHRVKFALKRFTSRKRPRYPNVKRFTLICPNTLKRFTFWLNRFTESRTTSVHRFYVLVSATG